jgi:hypothetical protein
MNFFDQKDIGNQPLKLCPKVVKHPVCSGKIMLSKVKQLLAAVIGGKCAKIIIVFVFKLLSY